MRCRLDGELFMRLSRERLLAIGNLKLSNRLSVLSDGLIDKYCDALSAFVDAFPNIEAQFRKSLSVSGGERVLQLLSQMSDTLANIHADDLVRDCEKLRDIFTGGGSRDKFEAAAAAATSLKRIWPNLCRRSARSP